MKNSIFSIVGVLVLAVFVAPYSEFSAVPNNEATFLWEETTHDFGTVPQGTPVSHTFRFTNDGSDPLLITSVTSSCGCTVTDYSKDPIPGGEQGFVKVTYNAAKAGLFSKTATIGSNATQPQWSVTVKGEVIP